MIRAPAGILTLMLVGIPLLTAPSAAVGGLGAAAALLCGGAIVRFSIPLLTAGASVAMVEYALALLISGGPPDFVSAIALGLTLCLLFHLMEFAARFREAAMEVEVLRGQVRFWVGVAATTAAGGILVVLAAGSMAIGLPLQAHAPVAALGVLGAFVGAVQAILRAGQGNRSEGKEGKR